MRDAVAQAAGSADALIMAAAPADFRAANVADQKIKKNGAPPAIALASAPDILVETRGARKPGAVVVGFALETQDALANARQKLQSKGLDAVVINDALEPGAAFGSETNRVTLLFADGRTTELPMMSKVELADVLLDRVEEILGGR